VSGVGTAGGWCHGAAGALTCRLGILEALDGRLGERGDELLDPVRRDVDAAMQLLERSHPYSDTVCCGTAGQIQALLYAADVLDRSDLRGEAMRRAASLAERVHRDELRLMARGIGPGLAPSFMQGALGVAATLIQCARGGRETRTSPLVAWR
jgi:lantibiotic modifying enzyme